MKLYKDFMELVGTFAIVSFVVLVLGIQTLSVISNLIPFLFLFVLVVTTPITLKRYSNEPRNKVMLIQASAVVVLVGLLLSQTFSLGPIPLLISLMVGAILLSISLQIKTQTPSEPFET